MVSYGNDLTAYTDGFMARVREEIATNWNCFTVILVRPASVISARIVTNMVRLVRKIAALQITTQSRKKINGRAEQDEACIMDRKNMAGSTDNTGKVN